MQLLTVVLYNHRGQSRKVDFRPGRLNIVTGRSRTGKSALLDIVDFCLGRDEPRIPPGIIANHVAWFGTLWEFDEGGRVFLGRPAVKDGKASTSRAMIAFGGAELQPPDFDDLTVNTDSSGLREQVGHRLGMGDAALAPAEGSVRQPYSVGLGQAAIFLFQQQSEVASRATLFHRQTEEGMPASIRDTLPFFLGAVQGDQAEKQSQLRSARRELRRIEAELDSARNEAEEMEVRLQSLLHEAHAVGLTDVATTDSVERGLEILQRIRYEQPRRDLSDADLTTQDRRLELEALRVALRQDLGRVLDSRALLLDSTVTEGGYNAAIAQQLSRLRSLDLLPHKGTHGNDACPVCNQELKGADPVADQLRGRLEGLSQELEALAAAQPGRQKALETLGSKATEIRQQLIAVEEAVAALRASATADDSIPDADRQQFVRGRIDATLSRTVATDTTHIEVLRRRAVAAAERVSALENELDDDVAREKLTSLLIALGRDMTLLAQALQLEHSEESVRLDLAKLTVVTDTPRGPATLNAMGSGANWLGYHLVTHLALHRFFVEQNRPVPGLLMLDQPTQVFYESMTEAEKLAVIESGVPADEDHENVARMFQLMIDVVEALSPKFQIIVSDHANLPEEWFADAVEHNWREGDGLIPRDWIDDDHEDEVETPAGDVVQDKEPDGG